MFHKVSIVDCKQANVNSGTPYCFLKIFNSSRAELQAIQTTDQLKLVRVDNTATSYLLVLLSFDILVLLAILFCLLFLVFECTNCQKQSFADILQIKCS